ncbi:MAG: hypothetical protein IJJ91_10825 [Synergistaceae bacterium]|nr:hypothetical protein [Synergistaceae bacterium]
MTNSTAWREKADARLDIDGHKCQVCGAAVSISGTERFKGRTCEHKEAHE